MKLKKRIASFLNKEYWRTRSDWKKSTNCLVVIDENGNEKKYPYESIKGLKVFFYGGKNNMVTIQEPCVFHNVRIHVYGDGNRFFLNKIQVDDYLLINVYDGLNNRIEIGEKTVMRGVSIISYRSDCFIGADCLFSNPVSLWCGDGHTIFDKDSQKVLNGILGPVCIGNHVWIGEGVKILKNVSIPNQSIIGINSVVCKSVAQENVIIAGNPAKVVKTNIGWDKKSVVAYEAQLIKLFE